MYSLNASVCVLFMSICCFFSISFDMNVLNDMICSLGCSPSNTPSLIDVKMQFGCFSVENLSEYEIGLF